MIFMVLKKNNKKKKKQRIFKFFPSKEFDLNFKFMIFSGVSTPTDKKVLPEHSRLFSSGPEPNRTVQIIRITKPSYPTDL